MSEPLDALLRTVTHLTLSGLHTAGRVTSTVVDALAHDKRFAALQREWSALVWTFLDPPPQGAAASPDADADVRARFTELLRRSANIYEEDGEPALAAVVTQLSPDEARILRLLHHDGPVPVADLVRQPLIGGAGHVVLAGLSMVADRAGCRYPDRCGFYLTNLERLGVVEVVHEPLPGHGDYGLIEGRADYIDAAKPIRQDRTARVRMAKHQLRLTVLGSRLTGVVFGPT